MPMPDPPPLVALAAAIEHMQHAGAPAEIEMDFVDDDAETGRSWRVTFTVRREQRKFRIGPIPDDG